MMARAAFTMALLFALPVSAAAGSLGDWARAAFGEAVARQAPPAGTMVLRRQDHGQFMRNKSVIGTPLKIGSQPFVRGLGTHSVSEIALHLPPEAARFQAVAGIDNNYDTAGTHGTARFSVEIDGKQVFRSVILRGGQEGEKVDAEIPGGAKLLVLKVDDAGDDPSHDHSDWAEARLLLKEGKTMWLDEMKLAEPAAWLSGEVPISFTCGGKSSRDLLPKWDRTTHDGHDARGSQKTVSWQDPETGMRMTATVTALSRFNAVEWLLRFENTGQADTPLLEGVQALDLQLQAGKEALALDTIRGDDCSINSFVPVNTPIQPGQPIRLAPHGGRPSNGTFPFFNLDCGGRGLFVAIGWTGQWQATVARSDGGVARVTAGMELTHLKLHPGESIRTPRILLMAWEGRNIDAHNQFRRLLVEHYLPKTKGHVMPLAIGSQSFNMNHGGRRPEWNTEAGQLAAAAATARLGCDTHWLDAAWFDGGFPNGVGNWTVRKKEYPNGLKPIGRECERLGLKFLIWWEPERVAPGTRIAREHPEFVLGGDKGGLFNLGDPKARQWLTDLLLQGIDEFGMHTYRNDFNMDPLPYWRGSDPPDRQGMAEIRYVEGLYEMWDAIRAKHPDFTMDDCASGGRRIDLEMCSRAVIQTRSDTACAPGRGDWDQAQTHGLSLFLPIHATICWGLSAYDCRSAAAAGFLGEWDILDPQFPVEPMKAAIAEIKENQKFWLGDYYPLTACSTASDAWMAWQLHRSDLGEGIVLAFRHAASPYMALGADLEAVDPAATYDVTFIDEQRQATTRRMTGKDLASLELRIGKPGESLLVRYKQVK